MRALADFMLLVALGGTLVGCRTEPTRGSVVSSSARPTPSASAASSAGVRAPKVVHAPLVPATELANAPGPAPSGSALAREVRETAVLALFSDVTLVRSAPIVDLEPGREFDWDLRDRVAPRIAVPSVKVRMKELKVDGPLPLFVVQRTVRQIFGRLRVCYTDGLGTNEDLQGTVVVEFVIEPDGKVSRARNTGGTLKAPDVLRCIARSYESLVFPAEATRSTAVHTLDLSSG